MFRKIRESYVIPKFRYMRHEKLRKKNLSVQNVAVAGSHHYHSLSLKMLFVCLYPQGNGITRKIWTIRKARK